MVSAAPPEAGQQKHNSSSGSAERDKLCFAEIAEIKLMTMHKSKGLEAEVVIILEADEGVIPKTHPDTKLFTV